MAGSFPWSEAKAMNSLLPFSCLVSHVPFSCECSLCCSSLETSGGHRSPVRSKPDRTGVEKLVAQTAISNQSSNREVGVGMKSLLEEQYLSSRI